MNMLENGKKFVQKRKWIILTMVLVLGMVSVCSAVFIRKKSTAAEPIMSTAYMQKYENQSHKLNGYIVTLKYAVYSDKTKNGCCVFEVEKENGVMETPEFFNGNQINSFGEREKFIQICPNASGHIRNRAEMKGKKLIVYTDFEIGTLTPEDIKPYQEHQLILYSTDKTINYYSGIYGFHLEDNIGGKEFEIDNNTKVSVSHLGVLVEASERLNSLKVEAITAKNKKKVLFDLEGKEDIKGSASEGYAEDEGIEKYTYSYNFSDMYDMGNLKSIYINGEKME